MPARIGQFLGPQTVFGQPVNTVHPPDNVSASPAASNPVPPASNGGTGTTPPPVPTTGTPPVPNPGLDPTPVQPSAPWGGTSVPFMNWSAEVNSQGGYTVPTYQQSQPAPTTQQRAFDVANQIGQQPGGAAPSYTDMLKLLSGLS